MPNRVFVPQVVSAVAPNDELYIFVNNTTTQRTVYTADGVTVLPQPLLAYDDLTFDDFYILDNTACTLLLQSQDGTVRPGFPMNDVYPSSVAGSSAASVAFDPIELVAETNVQDAIEVIAELATGQPAAALRSVIPWRTGGTGNAFTITPDPPLTAYGETGFFLISPDRSASTGAVTLNVSGLGTRELRARDSEGAVRDLFPGEVRANRTLGVSYDGVRFYIEFGQWPIRITSGNDTIIRHSDGTMALRKIVELNLATTAFQDFAFPTGATFLGDSITASLSCNGNPTTPDTDTSGFLDALGGLALIAHQAPSPRWRVSVRDTTASTLPMCLRAEGRWY